MAVRSVAAPPLGERFEYDLGDGMRSLADSEYSRSITEAIELTRAIGHLPDPRERAFAWEESSVLIATMCSWTHLPAVFADCREDLVKPPSFAEYRADDSAGIVAMRNKAVSALLSREHFTHLLMLDTDMVYPPETIQELVLADKDIVAGLACGRVPVLGSTRSGRSPYFPNTFWKKVPEGRFLFERTAALPTPPGLHRCGAVSFGGVLIKRKVFEGLKRPCFDNSHWQKMPSGKRARVGEDMYFQATAAEAGFEVWCDTSLHYGHLIEAAVYPEQAEDGTCGHRVSLVGCKTG